MMHGSAEPLPRGEGGLKSHTAAGAPPQTNRGE